MLAHVVALDCGSRGILFSRFVPDRESLLGASAPLHDAQVSFGLASAGAQYLQTEQLLGSLGGVDNFGGDNM